MGGGEALLAWCRGVAAHRRELHDVIGHSISVITIQSEAATRSLTRSPDAVPGFLETITATGRQALHEMRHLLDVLRPEDASRTYLNPACRRCLSWPSASPQPVSRRRSAWTATCRSCRPAGHDGGFEVIATIPLGVLE
jgi:hypothetical protein